MLVGVYGYKPKTHSDYAMTAPRIGLPSNGWSFSVVSGHLLV